MPKARTGFRVTNLSKSRVTMKFSSCPQQCSQWQSLAMINRWKGIVANLNWAPTEPHSKLPVAVQRRGTTGGNQALKSAPFSAQLCLNPHHRYVRLQESCSHWDHPTSLDETTHWLFLCSTCSSLACLLSRLSRHLFLKSTTDHAFPRLNLP